MIVYRALTRQEFEEVKAAVEKVSTQKLNFGFNHHNGIRISASKRDSYQLDFDNAERVLTVLEELNMFTLPHKQELEIGRKFKTVHSQIFSMIYKLA